MKLEVIYNGTIMECIKETEVFIEKHRLNNLSKTEQSNLKEEPSWKGQYYNIQKGDKIVFDRSNNWDVSYFKLESGVEFKIDCGNPLSFFTEDSFKLLYLKGNPYDKRYLNFIKKYPKYEHNRIK